MMKQEQFFVYIMTNKKNGTLYIGVSNNLSARVWEHKQNISEGFTKKYSLYSLVYFEQYTDIRLAIEREKQMKKWRRKWKLQLIEKVNPDWKDLYEDIV